MGKQLTDIVRILFPALQEEKRQQILKDFERTEVQYLYEYGATLYAGVKETVVFLYQKYNLFIVSNCQDGYVSAFLHAHNLTPYFKDTAMSGQTGLEKGSNIKNLMKKHGIREALIKSAAVDGERFFVKTRFEKRGNTVCISRFSNRRIGGKDPSSAVGDLFRGSLMYRNKSECVRMGRTAAVGCRILFLCLWRNCTGSTGAAWLDGVDSPPVCVR